MTEHLDLRRRQHQGQRLVLLLELVELGLGTGLGQAEEHRDGYPGHRDGAGEPRQPGQRSPGAPRARVGPDLGRQLASARGGGQYLGAQLGWRLSRGGEGHRGGYLTEPADLGGARRAAAQVPVEPVALGTALDRVERVRPGQGVQILAKQFHQLTPRQSRIRISPSRILVLIAPSVTFSSSDTCR